ncbi:hydroxymethylglutaryl-CoA synthase family protein [Roseateles flavus]|uniref:Hydroxymethylglutaryl-CoA synthase family protein n=1 Tax=Roseateles flavus TaxID=3149041 RepID=A0ABV0GBI7_9BURK
MTVGIEALNVYAGAASLDVFKLAEYRELDMTRFQNLLMREKSVALPYEDPVTYGINAAKPIIDALSEEDRNKIEMVITCTESSFDFSKSMSTYFHKYLGLKNNCRLFELKNACYSGVAGLQMAINFILSKTSPGAKALVIATDLSRFIMEEGGDQHAADWSFAEPSSGAGAVAVLVSDQPRVFQIDVGANGYYGYEVMDTCRPTADSETGDSDLSLLSYLDCCENAFKEYQKRVAGVDYATTFGFLAFHTPFGGMIKGAHRNLMRRNTKFNAADIEKDFERRALPGLNYCQRLGNIMGATAMLSLASTIDNGDFREPQRIGVFSYGSGCCSEFFSGVTTAEGQGIVRSMKIGEQLDRRYRLSIDEYRQILSQSRSVRFGTRNIDVDGSFVKAARKAQGRPTLFLSRISDYHREYEWVS